MYYRLIDLYLLKKYEKKKEKKRYKFKEVMEVLDQPVITYCGIYYPQYW